MSDHTITMTSEALEGLRTIANDAVSAFESYGPCPETGEAMASALRTISALIGLGGTLTGGDESMPINGRNDWLYFGVARHTQKVPHSYYESALALFAAHQEPAEAERNAQEMVTEQAEKGWIPYCKTYGVHS